MSSHLDKLNVQFDTIYANRIITTSEEEWLRIKHKGLGGTDKAIIAGISSWTTPVGLFYEKIEEFKYEDRKFNMTMEIKRDSWDIYKFPKTGKGTPISHRHAF